MSHATVEQQGRRPLLVEDWCVFINSWDPRTVYTAEWPSQRAVARFLEAGQHYHFPVSRCLPTTAERFRELVESWKAETEFLSSPIERALHPAYQQIIGIGPDALPLLLQELGREPDHWFWALKAIAGVDPVQPTDRGRIKEMTRAWIEWGRDQGLIQ